ncbi:MAG: hypothetical protein ACMVY4_02435 [Minwuia sp.]|uniref:hypothetical protein n=1 Tax=Minwuia sp. TaxID=2493630 RepID=UPI003A8B59FC
MPLHDRPGPSAQRAINQAASKRRSEAIIDAGVGSTARIVVGSSTAADGGNQGINRADEARLRESSIEAVGKGQATIIVGGQTNIQPAQQVGTSSNSADRKRLLEAQIDTAESGVFVLNSVVAFTGSPAFQERRRMRGREAIDRAFAKRANEALIRALDRGDRTIVVVSGGGDEHTSADLVRLRETALRAVDRAHFVPNVLIFR